MYTNGVIIRYKYQLKDYSIQSEHNK